MSGHTPHRLSPDAQPMDVLSLVAPACSFSVGSVAGHHALMNQDSYACRDPDFFAVADGVGGGCLGEVASAMLVRQLETLKAAQQDQVLRILQAADTAIAQRIAQEGQGPGAAVCAAVWRLDDAKSDWLAMTVGDCQVVVLARQQIDWQIRWSSPLQTYASMNLQPPAGVSMQAPANMVGCGMSLPPQFHAITLMPGEWILLCSDGFHQVFSGTALVNLLRETAWPLQAKTAQRWCQLAMQAGAQDDVTVIVIEPTTTVTSRGYSWFWTVVSLTVIFAVLWKFK